MDPPPQAHTGVSHDPEYTMVVRAGQLSVIGWTAALFTLETSLSQDLPAGASAVVRGPPSAASAAS